MSFTVHNLFVSGHPEYSGVTVYNKDVYAYCASGTKIIKISKTGIVTDPFISCGDARHLTTANGFLFVASRTSSGRILAYSLNTGSLVATSAQLTNSASWAITTDWDEISSTFNVFVGFEAGVDIQYCSFDGSSFGSLNNITNASNTYGLTVRRCTPTDGARVYLYVANDSSTIREYNITSIGSITGPSNIDLGGGFGTGSIAWFEDAMYAAKTFNGLYKFTFTVDGATGALSSPSRSTIANDHIGWGWDNLRSSNGTIENAEIIENGDTVSELYITCMQVAVNRATSGINLFVSTVGDNYSGVYKFYSSGGNGLGGDPHIQPLIGEQYLVNDEFLNLFKNLVGKNKITINCKTWLLPESALEIYRATYGKIFDTMKNFTYIQQLYINVNNEETLIFDMDSLEPIEHVNKNSICLSEKRITQNMFSIRLQKHTKIKKNMNPTSTRTIIINCNNSLNNHNLHNSHDLAESDSHDNIKIFLIITSNLTHSDRNNIRLVIDSDYDINCDNFAGCLIKESSHNILTKLY